MTSLWFLNERLWSIINCGLRSVTLWNMTDCGLEVSLHEDAVLTRASEI
uniref:Uncharacterized protein n=1 Tax=Anguilla anguilla TaxID=7936 RepID=A0A0E9SGY2_ANGAN